MNSLLLEIESLLTKNLKTSVDLKNQGEQRELALLDQMKQVFLGVIDTLDSFERIEGSVKERTPEDETAIKTITRFKTVEKKLINLLRNYGITKLEFPDNRLIVGFCEVIDTEADSKRKNDEIVTVVRNGYIRGSELIRAAQIIVVKN
ncbi:MAG: nucleotide exchange factor GrpE [Flavipsychrobacter sp.]|nr:nucleotide exchange factor GrpE [Flavipsychrobacter sp.]